MILVFDTNSIFNFLLLDHPLFSILAFFGKEFGISVAFPEIVIEECTKYNGLRMAKAYSEIENSKRIIEKNSFDVIDWNDPRRDVESEDNWYRTKGNVMCIFSRRYLNSEEWREWI